MEVKLRTILIELLKSGGRGGTIKESGIVSGQMRALFYVIALSKHTRVIPKSTSDWLVKINALS